MNQRLRDLTNRYVDMQEDERKRLARQVHDELGQELAAAKMRLSVEGDTYTHLDLIGVLDDLIQSSRQLSKSLRPAQLDHFGLSVAINDHMIQFSNIHNFKFEFYTDISHIDIDSNIELSLFRIYQEGVHNIHCSPRYGDFFGNDYPRRSNNWVGTNSRHPSRRSNLVPSSQNRLSDATPRPSQSCEQGQHLHSF